MKSKRKIDACAAAGQEGLSGNLDSAGFVLENWQI